MCGIAGLVEAPGVAVDDATLRAMGDALKHRGPDDGRTWRGDAARGLAHAGFSHRRLSILDIAGGVQPMTGSDVVTVFNGQIYNHVELRRALIGRGARFATDHSDTEVLVHGLRAWGALGLCERLSGMFAFACVDLEKRVLVLARDAQGKKPLYVASAAFFADGASHPRLAFASEPEALEVLPGARKQVDVAALARYFAFDFVPDPDCIYDGVLKLEPGHVLELSLDQVSHWASRAALLSQARCFRDLSFTRGRPAATHEGRVEQLRRTIDDAVQTRMVHADVPVGIFLSGGIDSSLVAALASRHSSKIETFSIAFQEESYDESQWARMVARHIGSQHHEETLHEQALLDVLPRLAAHLAEPFADHSVVPTHLLSSFARKSVTVALGGDGGDELFLGYSTFLVERARPRLLDLIGPRAKPAFARLLALARMLPVSHEDFAFDFKVQRALDGIAEPHPLRRHQLFLTGATDARVRALLSPAARTVLRDRLLDGDGSGDTPGRGGRGDVLAMLDALEERARAAGARDVFDVLQYGYAKTYMAAGVLQKVDRASMASSLEVRAPLLDNSVVDLALALRSSEKLARFTTKAILKEVAAPLLPRAIVHRKKKGFGMPVASWLIGPLRPLVEEALSARALADDGMLDAAAVRTLVDEHMEKRANHRKILWSLLMYRLWRTRAGSANTLAS